MIRRYMEPQVPIRLESTLGLKFSVKKLMSDPDDGYDTYQVRPARCAGFSTNSIIRIKSERRKIWTSAFGRKRVILFCAELAVAAIKHYADASIPPSLPLPRSWTLHRFHGDVTLRGFISEAGLSPIVLGLLPSMAFSTAPLLSSFPTPSSRAPTGMLSPAFSQLRERQYNFVYTLLLNTSDAFCALGQSFRTIYIAHSQLQAQYATTVANVCAIGSSAHSNDRPEAIPQEYPAVRGASTQSFGRGAFADLSWWLNEMSGLGNPAPDDPTPRQVLRGMT